MISDPPSPHCHMYFSHQLSQRGKLRPVHHCKNWWVWVILALVIMSVQETASIYVAMGAWQEPDHNSDILLCVPVAWGKESSLGQILVPLALGASRCTVKD